MADTAPVLQLYDDVYGIIPSNAVDNDAELNEEAQIHYFISANLPSSSAWLLDTTRFI